MAKKEIKVREIAPEEIKLDDRNLNRHTDKGRDLVNKSFSELGAGRSGVSDKHGKIIAGNLSVETALAKGLKILEVETEVDTYVIVKRKDLDLDSKTDNRARKLALADNSTSAVSLDWNWEEMASVEKDFGFDAKEWGIDGLMAIEDNEDENNNYSRKVNSPNYEPKNEKPEIADLVDTTYCKKLIEEIEAADISSEDKEFLKIAAARHNVFNYESIADYYANSEKEVQCLMENSALIVIDFNRAIELGFVRLADEIANQYSEDYDDED